MSSTTNPTSPCSPEQLKAAKTALLEERDSLVSAHDVRHDGSTDKPDVTDGPGETEHLSVAEYQELVNRLDALGEKALVAIDEALERIENGTYGICTACNEAIAVERLEALPAAAFCTPCQQTAELS